MKANMKVFGYMSKKEARQELKANLKEVKKQSEELLKQMDLTVGRCKMNLKEVQRWGELRNAIIEFRTIEVD